MSRENNRKEGTEHDTGTFDSDGDRESRKLKGSKSVNSLERRNLAVQRSLKRALNFKRREKEERKKK